MTGVEKPEWFERVLDAYEHDGAEAAWALFAESRGGRVVTGVEKHAGGVIPSNGGHPSECQCLGCVGYDEATISQVEAATGVEKHAQAILDACNPPYPVGRLSLPFLREHAEAVLVAAREHDTRQAERDEQIAQLIEQMICDDAERMRGLNVGLWRVDEKKLAALRLLRGGEA